MAVTSDATRLHGALRVPRPGKAARRFSIGFLLGIALALVGVAAVGQSLAGRILPGVVAGGVDVSGMTPAEAHAALEASLGRLEHGRVVVTTVHGSATIDVDDLGRTVDLDAMVAEAYALGRDGTRFGEVITAVRQVREPVTLPIPLTYDPASLAEALDAFAARASRPAIGARVIATPSGFAIVAAVPGIRVETDGAAAVIAAALVDPAMPATLEVAASTIPLAPTTGDADARRAMAAAERVAADLTLKRGSKTWTIKGERIRTWIVFGGSGATYGPSVDPSEVPAALSKVRKAMLKKPREATFLKTRAGKVFGVRASASGRALDEEKVVAGILAALDARAAGAATGAPVKVPTMKVPPEYTTAEATTKAPLVVRIGTWTTYYTSSAHNGFSANISIPARKLNGVVIQPGQVLDFWKAIGEVSFRAGYKLGGAIVGGRTVEGRALAGGICATSTTLFNAAARGGLEILARQPHWYYITRYPLGLDATVSQSQTMRFRNDTKHPILITSVARPGLVRFELWSVPNGRTVTWSTPRVTNVVRGYDTVQYTSSLPKGARERIEWPVDGKDVSVTRTVRDASGRLIHRDTFVSHYHRMVGITLVGR